MNTRRKTRRGRLTRLDRFVLDREAALLTGPGVVVDLGIGAIPWTTLELARALAERFGPCPSVVGVDHDPVVVARALEETAPGVRFVEGGFALPPAARPALLIRAMNVLRDYPPDAVAPAHRLLGEALVDGGLLVEGTCGSRGDVLCAWLVRKAHGELFREGLLFSTDFSRGFAPYQLRDRLPRDLRGASGPETAIGRFLADWTAAVEASGGRTAQERFEEGGKRLAATRDDFEVAPDGFLVWRPRVGASLV